MAKITYANKIPKRERLSSYNNDEFTLADANEIKTVVNALDDVVSSIQQNGGTQSTIAYATTVSIDFGQVDPVQIIALTGNITFSNASNKAVAKSKIIILTAGASTRTLVFPASWIFLDEVAPTSLAANKIGILSLYCKGTAETDVIVSYSAQL